MTTARQQWAQERADEVVRLYGEGLTSYEVAAALSTTQATVLNDLRRKGVQARRPGPQGPRRPRRHLTLVPSSTPVTFCSLEGLRTERVPPTTPKRQVPAPSRPLVVDPSSAAVAFSADRGWHMVNVPPAWALEMLADRD